MGLLIFKCGWCGEHLSEAGDLRQPRADKKFCGSACRGKYHRWFKNLERQQHVMMLAQARIVAYLEHPQAQLKAVTILRDAKARIDAELKQAGIKAVR